MGSPPGVGEARAAGGRPAPGLGPPPPRAAPAPRHPEGRRMRRPVPPRGARSQAARAPQVPGPAADGAGPRVVLGSGRRWRWGPAGWSPGGQAQASGGDDGSAWTQHALDKNKCHLHVPSTRSRLHPRSLYRLNWNFCVVIDFCPARSAGAGFGRGLQSPAQDLFRTRIYRALAGFYNYGGWNYGDGGSDGFGPQFIKKLIRQKGIFHLYIFFPPERPLLERADRTPGDPHSLDLSFFACQALC